MDKQRQETGDEMSRPGATTDLPHDRITVERFRQAFPRARWNEALHAWFVPGTTAEKRIGLWRAGLEAETGSFADEKGRDAFAFDPIESPYLKATAAALEIRTPFSRTVVNEIKNVPQARWDAQQRIWTVPYRSLEELRQRWPVIEAAAVRNEPEARKARREEARDTPEEREAKARQAERRRRRYPVPTEDAPPLDQVIGTRSGLVIFTGSEGELAEPDVVGKFYFYPEQAREYVWLGWRPPSLEELVAAWPARMMAAERDIRRGWWLPDLEELRAARKVARSRQRKSERAGSQGEDAEQPQGTTED